MKANQEKNKKNEKRKEEISNDENRIRARKKVTGNQILIKLRGKLLCLETQKLIRRTITM